MGDAQDERDADPHGRIRRAEVARRRRAGVWLAVGAVGERDRQADDERDGGCGTEEETDAWAPGHVSPGHVMLLMTESARP